MLHTGSNGQLILGEIWHINDANCLECIPQGALAVDKHGSILACGEARHLKQRYAQLPTQDFNHRIVLPGFIDAHLHYPQLDIMGCYGESLLGWLEKFTFPEEASFGDTNKATIVAERFFRELLANGTTLACIYSSSHLSSTQILFRAAEKFGVRAIIGKVSMDQNAPKELLSTVAQDYADNEQLLQTWHKKDDRLFVALTPRFAPTCSMTLMKSLRHLKQKFSDVYVQTHFAENLDEIAWVKKCFPSSRDYLEVYEDAGLLGEKTLLAHGIYATDAELKRLQATNTIMVHCPSSNLFLGSGLFPARRYSEFGIPTLMGSDIAGGNSLSMWRTMADAYKIQRLLANDQQFSPTQLLRSVTVDAAKALGLGDRLGNFSSGKCADFQVLDAHKSRLLKAKFTRPMAAEDKVFAMVNLADDRLTDAVYVQGKKVYP